MFLNCSEWVVTYYIYQKKPGFPYRAIVRVRIIKALTPLDACMVARVVHNAIAIINVQKAYY